MKACQSKGVKRLPWSSRRNDCPRGVLDGEAGHNVGEQQVRGTADVVLPVAIRRGEEGGGYGGGRGGGIGEDSPRDGVHDSHRHVALDGEES